MTTFKDRFNTEYNIMKNLVAHYGCRKVLDAACGTGLHAIALSKLGVEAKGIDLSAKMIQQAKVNAQSMRVNTEFQVLPLKNVHSLVNNLFDSILFLGNSLPHIISTDELFQILNAFAQILKPEGTLIIQLLNYEKILKQKERIVSVKKHGSTLFIRFYDFLEKNIRFNLLSIDQESDPIKNNLFSTLLRPYVANELLEKETLNTKDIDEIMGNGKKSIPEEIDAMTS